ncbi:type II/IV secretion system protein [Candidatus Jorgensenbacteria bacterium]|nr:type II/IV secretion system protein [Candidatus Jorgensenbacteria bacterium]
MALSNQTLKKILTKNNILPEEEFAALEIEAERLNISVPRLLIAEGKLTQQHLLELESKFLNVPIFDPTLEPLKLEVMGVLPELTARERQVLVFGRDTEKNIYHIAMMDPTDIDNINFLKEYLKAEIEPYITSLESLRFGYQLYKRMSSENFEAVISAKVTALKSSLKGIEENILESIPLVELLDTIVGYAATIDASDIYLQPEEDWLKIRFRVDGLLRDVISMDRSISDGLVARIKTLGGLRIDEHYKPQDGRFRFRSSSDIDLDIRIAIMPTMFGEKSTLRLLSSAHAFLTLEELGMDQTSVIKFQQIIKKPHGMILSTGPTGSGKTTTIYTTLALLNKPEAHIVSIEDPIEYIIPNVSQTQVNLQMGITFATGLRSMLRHSPDIIIVGEIRDNETSDIAINAALTGHLIVSTLHTNDATSAVIRLLDLGIQPFLIGATLNAIIAQRLVRRVCPNCKTTYSPDPALLQKFEQDIRDWNKTIEIPKKLYRGTGCNLCHQTGYHGRIGLFELFTIDENVRNIISAKTITTDNLRKAAQAQGMISILEDGFIKVKNGLTTIEEIIRVMRE